MIAKIGVLLAAGAIASAATTANWTTELEPKGESMVRGTAQVEAKDSTGATARITITGGKEGEQLPWHVHTGACDNAGPPIGGDSAYTPLAVGADGSAKGDATITVPLSASQSYSVNVHRSTTDAAIISCGTLKQATMPTPE